MAKVQRSPPPTRKLAATLMAKNKAHDSESNSNISDLEMENRKIPSISQRSKRKRTVDFDEDLKAEMKLLFSEFKKEHDTKLDTLMRKIDDIKEQNMEISKAVDFVSQKYDEILLKIQELQQERTNSVKYMQSLENRIETLERSIRSCSIEVRNIPKKLNESKESLSNLLENLGQLMKIDIKPSDIKDVFRQNNKLGTNKPIIAEFNTMAMRDKVLKSAKTFKDQSGNRLNTGHLRIDGPNLPVYISENLTVKNKKLHFLARDFAKANNYTYCWISHGRILLRKQDDSPHIYIGSELDLDKLKGKK